MPDAQSLVVLLGELTQPQHLEHECEREGYERRIHQHDKPDGADQPDARDDREDQHQTVEGLDERHSEEVCRHPALPGGVEQAPVALEKFLKEPLAPPRALSNESARFLALVTRLRTLTLDSSDEEPIWRLLLCHEARVVDGHDLRFLEGSCSNAECTVLCERGRPPAHLLQELGANEHCVAAEGHDLVLDLVMHPGRKPEPVL